MTLHQIETVAVLSRYFSPSEIHRLLRLARSHRRLAEAKCDRPFTDRDEKREATIEKTIREIIAGAPKVSEFPTFDGDPRGFTVKLHLPGGESNTFGGKEVGYGI